MKQKATEQSYLWLRSQRGNLGKGGVSRKVSRAAVAALEALEKRDLFAFTAGVDFQPAGAATPSGYLADTGAVYANRNDGYSYGWSVDNSANTRDRNVLSDQKKDTLALMQLYGAAKWEIAVPNGTYQVHLVAGDPSYTDSVYKINAENTLVVNGTPTSSNPFVEGTATVKVTDGRLTLSNASGSSNNKMAYVDISQVDTSTPVTTYLSDMNWASATNGWGPVEKDMSNGEQAAGDGRTIGLGGVSYDKGLGVHANSSITYNLNGKYDSFRAVVGLDDEADSNGSVVFQVFADGKKVYGSGIMTRASAAKSIAIALTGVSQLTLVVKDTGDGNTFDHADWANARLVVGNPIAVPAVPSNLTATATSTSQIDLNWKDNSGNESGFKIQRSSDNGATFSQIAAVGTGVTTYSNTGLAAGTKYTYRVIAYNVTGDSAPTANASATTLSATPTAPAAPSNLAASAASSSQINLSWNDNSSNETGFRIQRSTDGGASFSQIATVGAGVRTYSNTGLTANTTYTYRVTAYNAAGDSGATANASATTQANPVPGNAAPTVSITNPTNGSMVAGPGYYLIRANAADSDGKVSRVEFRAGNTILGVTTAAPYMIDWTGVAPGTYSVTATAYDNLGAATTSNPVSVTVVAPQAGTTYFVDPNGSNTAAGTAGAPVKTIGRALQLAKAGDTITVRAGTYRESLSLTTSGTATAPITIQAETPGSVVLDGTGMDHVIDSSGAKYIQIKGITVRNGTNPAQFGAITTGDNWLLQDVLVEQTDGVGILVGGNNNVLLRVTTRNNDQMGWGGREPSNLLIKDSITSGNNPKGTYDPAWESGGGKFQTTDGVLLDNIRAFDNVGPGVWFDYQNKNYAVINSTIYNNKGRSNDWEGPGVAFEISEGPGRLENCVIYGNTGASVGVEESMNVVVQNNLLNDYLELRDMQDRAPYKMDNVQILNNRFKNANIQTSIGTWNNTSGSAKHIVIDGNTYDVGSGQSLIQWGSTNYTSLSSIRSSLGFETNGVIGSIPFTPPY